MNNVWSSCIQKIGTLYSSRALRFSDLFWEKYTEIFAIGHQKSILEIGCGPGALCRSLRRWYPDAEITGADRDSEFIEFAREKVPGVSFVEEDAVHLSFGESSFDVTISNTVAEHIEPSGFFKEQYRVLKPEGVCLILSSRRGINIPAPCISEISDFEKEIWSRVEKRRGEIEKEYGVCLYPMNEREYPICMQKYGFRNVSVDYVTVNLTPDHPACPGEMAHAMIDANWQGELDSIDVIARIAPDLVSADELEELRRLTNGKYQKRRELYEAGIKQWDTNVSVIMVIRGVK